MFGVGRVVHGAAALAAILVVLSGLGAGCEDDQRYAYVKVHLATGAMLKLRNGHAALTFVSGTGMDFPECGPDWAQVPTAWGAREECKDQWAEIEQFKDQTATWSITDQGQYDWVLVLLELFDGEGTIRYRSFKTLNFVEEQDLGDGSRWDLDLDLGDLCPPPLAGGAVGQCCELGAWVPCTGVSLGEGVTFPKWCTDNPDHESCTMELRPQ